MSFLHGIEVVEIDSGPRPIQTARASVIGLVGTAPQGPLNEPVLIAGSRKEAVDTFGDVDGTHTLPTALDLILDQTGASIVVIRVDRAETDGVYDPDQTKANIIGGVDGVTGAYTGIQALVGAESVVHVTPRILLAPEFGHEKTVVDAMTTVAERLRGIVLGEGPNTTDDAVITYRGDFSSARVYLVDPYLTVENDAGEEVSVPASPLVAGLIVKTDNERGFWWSPSNRTLSGVLGTARPIDFVLGDPDARANILNENEVATVIHLDGYRLWGNRTCSSDSKWAFVSVRRTADMINESLLQAHLWAVDRNITRTYLSDVVEGVNAYLRTLQAKGAILGGGCWADPDLNTASELAQGNVYFDFDFTPPYPAEHITFRSHLVDDYLEELL